jgi:hypothetical protein
VLGAAAFSLTHDPDYTNNVVAASVNVTLGVTPGGSGSGPEATRRSE